MTQLQGSDKQVLWANAIRRELLDGIDRLIREFSSSSDEKFLAQAKAAREELSNEDDAGWWLDRRDISPMTLLCEMLSGGM